MFSFQVPHIAENYVDPFGYETSDMQVSSTSLPANLEKTEGGRGHRGGRQRQGPPAAFKSEEEARMWAKERQKKDNHNQSTGVIHKNTLFLKIIKF